MLMPVNQTLLNVPVSSLEFRRLIAVLPATTVGQAVAEMRRQRLGCVVVVRDGGRPQGMYTERLLLKMLLKNPDGLAEPVGRHMTTSCPSVAKDETIAQLIDRMERGKLRFLCVIDEQGKAEAIVGQKAVVAYLAEQFPREVKVQVIGSKMHMDQREGA